MPYMQAVETFMSLGINLIPVTLNYTAPADAIYNIVLSERIITLGT